MIIKEKEANLPKEVEINMENRETMTINMIEIDKSTIREKENLPMRDLKENMMKPRNKRNKVRNI